jgi:hypothetical protein
VHTGKFSILLNLNLEIPIYLEQKSYEGLDNKFTYRKVHTGKFSILLNLNLEIPIYLEQKTYEGLDNKFT